MSIVQRELGHPAPFPEQVQEVLNKADSASSSQPASEPAQQWLALLDMAVQPQPLRGYLKEHDVGEPALQAIQHLRAAALETGYAGDLIACGGILDGASWQAYRDLGVKAAQYWSALVYRGPLAAALIESELAQHDLEYKTIHRESLA